MFAEKSTALQRHGKRFMLAGKKVVFLKPSIDNRYSEDFIVTHDGKKVEAINVKITNENKVGIPLDLFEADVVCIDEVQFFPDQMITHIEKLIEQGKIVFVAGLDMDRYGKPFGIVPYLMAKADHVTKHHAVCVFVAMTHGFHLKFLMIQILKLKLGTIISQHVDNALMKGELNNRRK